MPITKNGLLNSKSDFAYSSGVFLLSTVCVKFLDDVVFI